MLLNEKISMIEGIAMIGSLGGIILISNAKIDENDQQGQDLSAI